MKIQTAFVLIAAVTSASAWGCHSSNATSEPIGKARASLHRAKGCTDLLEDLKGDAIYKLNRSIDRQIASINACITRSGNANCAWYGGGYAAEGGRAVADGALPPGTPSPSAAPKDAAASHSETNTQVAGVDEADIVKTDGANLYVLHGRAFKVVKAWPADSLAELSSFDIEGQPSEMFVDNGKVVVYSTVNGTGVYAAAGVTPKPGYQDFYMPGGAPARSAPAMAPYPGGGLGLSSPLTKITVLTLSGATASVSREIYFEGSYLDSRRVGPHVRTVLQNTAHGPLLKYGVYDLYPPQVQPGGDVSTPPSTAGDGAPAPKDATTPTNPYPTTGTEMITALEQLRAANLATLHASVLADWLPYTFVKEGAAVSTRNVACEDVYVPTIGSTESGLTAIASIDLGNPSAMPKQTAVLGGADTVYGSASTLYLAARAWIEPPFYWTDGADAVATSPGNAVASPPSTSGGGAPAPAPTAGVGTKTLKPRTTPTAVDPTVTAWATNETHIHKFDFASDPTFPNYVASGSVVGNVKDQFSLDDKDGYLRIATSESRLYVDTQGRYASPTVATDDVSDPAPARPSTVNHVFVMGENGAWLDKVGDVGELAPNEQIYSVRFVDGRGYVVTFRRVDPLFVIDLSQPKAPALLAALTIPGFSEYMHPLDAGHLLTIGRDASTTGRTAGLQLQIFDVADGANPKVLHKFTYTGDEYGQSDAEYDHKAFTYFADKKLLAFPYYAYDPSSANGMRSSLELFRVDLTAGFSKLGSIDHTDLVSKYPSGYCGGYYGPQVRRGVFLEDFAFSVSYGGIVAKDSRNLAAPGAKLDFPPPVADPSSGPVCAY